MPLRILSAAFCLCAALVFAVPSLRAAPPKAGFVDRLQSLSQLRAGDYQVLEDRLVGLQNAYESGAGPEITVEHAFFGFAVSGKDLEQKLGDWVSAIPGSYAARAARGFYYWRLAWLSRQGRYAHKTKAEQFRKIRGYFRQARSDFEAALTINGRLTVAYGMLISIAVADGTAKQRKNYLKRGLATDPASRITLYMYLYGLMPQWHGSLDAMRKFVAANDKRRKTNPKIPRIDGYLYRSIARGHRNEGRVRRAIDDLTEGLKFGDHWRLYRERGDLYQRLGQHKKAIADYTLALQVSPDEAEVLTDRAWSYKRLKQRDRAAQDLNRAISLDARIPRALRERARVYSVQKNYRAALRDLDNAMEFGAYDVRVVDARGRLHLSYTKDYGKAARDLKRATELAPENPRHWYNLAIAYYWQKDCKTVAATNRYLKTCAKGGKCRKNNIRTARSTIAGFIKTHTQCKMKLPPVPALHMRIWERFKSGLMKFLTWMFLKPKSQ